MTAKKFEWTTPETFQVVNVLSSTEERDANARWLVTTFLFAEDYLIQLLDDVPLDEPIDYSKVDWEQVYEAFLVTETEVDWEQAHEAFLARQKATT